METSRHISACIIVLLVSNILLSFTVFRDAFTKDADTPDYSSETLSYELLSPRIAKIDKDTLAIIRENFVPTYVPLKNKLVSFLNNSDGIYAIYFEDLYSSTWMGIKETTSFTPASLLKVPLAVTILKMSEENELNIDKKVMIKKEDLRDDFGNMFFLGENGTYSISNLLDIMLIDSDNTALRALVRQASDELIIEARIGLGLPISSVTQNENTIKLSPKQLSNIFRTLYYSGYLNRANSQKILELLTRAHFDNWLKAGLPKDTIMAHKFGKWVSDKSVHDCGIVYHPRRDYIICVMSINTSNEEAEKTISEISKIIYDYVSET